MEKQRQIKLISILALVVAAVGISLGFAAFSNTLRISSSATVRPDSSTFGVVFSSSNTSLTAGAVTGTASTGATAGSATISGTTISGLQANFTEPGQTVTYTFYAHNAGEYVAHLTDIIYGNVSNGTEPKTCIAVNPADTTESLLTAACEDITLRVDVGTISTTTTKHGLAGQSIAKGAYQTVKITIYYASLNENRADGDFNVSFGDITLNYTSAPYTVNTSAFTIFTASGDYAAEYTAEEGMTWGEWIKSAYNGGFHYNPDGTEIKITPYSNEGMEIQGVEWNGNWLTTSPTFDYEFENPAGIPDCVVSADDLIEAGGSYYWAFAPNG